MSRRSDEVLSIIVLTVSASLLAVGPVRADCVPSTPPEVMQEAFPDDLAAMDAEGEAAYAAKDYAAAEPVFRALLEAARTRLGATHQKTLEAQYDLGLTVFQRYEINDPRFAEADTLLTAFATGEEALFGPRHEVSGSAWSQVARIRQQSGNQAGAFAASAQASAILDAALCPTNEKAMAELAFRADLAEPDEPGKVAPLYAELYRRRAMAAPSDRATLVTGHRAARNYQRAGDVTNAEAMFTAVLPGFLAFGPDDPDAVAAQRNLAILLDANGRRAAAEPLFLKVLASRRRTAGMDDPKSLTAEIEYAEVLRDQDKQAEAEAVYRRVLAVRQAALGINAPETNAVRIEVARLVRLQAGRWQEAIDLSRAVFDAYVATPDTDPATLERAAWLAASAFSDAGRAAEAEPYLRKALALREQIEPGVPGAADVIRGKLRASLSAQMRFAEAADVIRPVYERARAADPADTDTLTLGYTLAIDLADAGDGAQAKMLADRGVETAVRVHGVDADPTMSEEIRRATVLQRSRNWSGAEAAWTQVAVHIAKVKGPATSEAAKAEQALGEMLAMQSRYEAAGAAYGRAAKIMTAARSADDPDAIDFTSMVGKMLGQQGKYAEQTAIYEAVLAHRLRLFGPQDGGTLTARSNLAVALFESGREVEGTAQHEQVYADIVRKYGADGIEAARSALNLSTALSSVGRLAEGEALARSTYAHTVKAFGAGAAVTLDAQEAVINALAIMGRNDEAIALSRQLVETDTKLYGVQSADTLMAMNNLAFLLREDGQLAEAERLDRETLAGRTAVLGPKHPYTIASMSAVATNINLQERYVEAEALQRQALALFVEVLGPSHPTTLTATSTLAETLYHQNRAAETVALEKVAYESALASLGPEHPLTLQLLSNYASNLFGFDVKLGEQMLADGYVIALKVLGPDHQTTMNLLANRAVNLSILGRTDEARALYQQVLDQRRRVLGPSHPYTLLSAQNLAVGMTQSRDWRGVETLMSQTLVLRKAREAENAAERLQAGAIESRRLLAQARLELAENRGAYDVFREASSIVLGRYVDRGIQSDENAAGLLKAYTSTFTGQVRAGWALAHQP